MTSTLVANEASTAIVDSKPAMRRLLADWAQRGWLRALDVAFADFLWNEVAAAPPLLILAAALTSHQLGRGHASLDLAATLDDPALALSLPPEGAVADGDGAVPLPGALLRGVSLAQWCAALEHPALVSGGAGDSPLVVVGRRVYLRRYWRYEEDLRAALERRLPPAEACLEPPEEHLRQVLARLFPTRAAGGEASVNAAANVAESAAESAAADAANAAPTNWQKLACALAARSAFSVITGGPGTGKTTTVVRLLALLQALALVPGAGERAGQPLRIRLAAPTGKAAARLKASIAGAVARLPLADLAQGEAIRASIPQQVSTLHRLLGSVAHSRHFRHHAGHPLALDVLVVDEASMVDLEMMTALLAALPPSARLILLGDKDQLASVEAGAVLGELCRRADAGHFTPATAQWLRAACGEAVDAALVDGAGRPLDQVVVMLRHSFRFAAGSGIGRLAAAVNSGDRAALRAVLNGGYADLARLPLAADGGPAANLAALVVDGGAGGEGSSARPGYRHYLELLRREMPARDAPERAFDAWAQAVLHAHGQFQVLAALRRGPWGVDGLNVRIARELHAAGLIEAHDGWYLGRPLLVTRNDYGLGLMNGDIGITLARPTPTGDGWGLRVAFPAGDDEESVKWVLPSRLQAVETVYALTVHKSQGSEFAHAALVLPDAPNPLLTRELVYTAITRAKDCLTLAHAGRLSILEQAIERRVLRSSGLLADA